MRPRPLRSYTRTKARQAASEGGSAATQVLSSAQELSQSSVKLRDEMEKFLARVRAA